MKKPRTDIKFPDDKTLTSIRIAKVDMAIDVIDKFIDSRGMDLPEWEGSKTELKNQIAIIRRST